METLSPPRQATDLATPLYYQLVHTLTGLLPPPLDDTPQSLDARNKAAIAKVAALLPVNANEFDLAAQCIAARAQAEDILRLLRQHAGDIALVTRLNAQYGAMVRTSLAVHGRLMRVQALRHKREAIEGAADQDARTQSMAERSMATVADPNAIPFQPAFPETARPTSPERARPMSPERARAASPEGARAAHEASPAETQPAGAPADRVTHRIEQSISENGTNSQDAAFETWLSEHPWNRRGSDKTILSAVVRRAIAKSRVANRELTANRRESPTMEYQAASA